MNKIGIFVHRRSLFHCFVNKNSGFVHKRPLLRRFLNKTGIFVHRSGNGGEAFAAEELAEGVAAEGGNLPLGGETQDAFQQCGEGPPRREEVVERPHCVAKPFDGGHPGDRERAQRRAFELMNLFQDLGTDARHVDI